MRGQPDASKHKLFKRSRERLATLCTCWQTKHDNLPEPESGSRGPFSCLKSVLSKKCKCTPTVKLRGPAAKCPDLVAAAARIAAVDTEQQPDQQPVKVSKGCVGGAIPVQAAALISSTAMSANDVMQDQPVAHES